jgi:TRAP-type C4-dicarboxylate transport system permease small subunit
MTRHSYFERGEVMVCARKDKNIAIGEIFRMLTPGADKLFNAVGNAICFAFLIFIGRYLNRSAIWMGGS